MTQGKFVKAAISKAKMIGYKVEMNRNGRRQINFGRKKLHEGHLKAIYPQILDAHVNVGLLIESVAPGRPCAHRPMTEIVAEIRKGLYLNPTPSIEEGQRCQSLWTLLR